MDVPKFPPAAVRGLVKVLGEDHNGVGWVLLNDFRDAIAANDVARECEAYTKAEAAGVTQVQRVVMLRMFGPILSAMTAAAVRGEVDRAEQYRAALVAVCDELLSHRPAEVSK